MCVVRSPPPQKLTTFSGTVFRVPRRCDGDVGLVCLRSLAAAQPEGARRRSRRGRQRELSQPGVRQEGYVASQAVVDARSDRLALPISRCDRPMLEQPRRSRASARPYLRASRGLRKAILSSPNAASIVVVLTVSSWVFSGSPPCGLRPPMTGSCPVHGARRHPARLAPHRADDARSEPLRDDGHRRLPRGAEAMR